jgi:hypothetical protein
MRKNGFESPYNGMQITTWIIFPVLLAHFLIFLTPTLPAAISIPLTIVYLIAAILAGYYGYVTTKTDSMDHKLHQHLYGSPHPDADTDPASPPESETKYCWVCQTNVYPQSMHCKYCDKCVSNFDHHCMWLNTCVGSANYKSFFQTVVWTFLFILLHVISIIVHLSLYFIEYDKVKSLAGSWFGGAGANIILVGFNIGFLVFTAFCAFMVLQLFVFHLGLKRENITTYQYILRDTAKKRERMRLSNMVMQRRVEELEKAGNSMEALCLKAGALQCCMPCDPVRRLVLQELDQAAENEENGNDDRSYSVADDNQEDGSNGGIELRIAGIGGADEENNGVQEAANGATSPSNNSTQVIS